MEAGLHAYILLAANPEQLKADFLKGFDETNLRYGRYILEGTPHLVVESILQETQPPSLSEEADERIILTSLKELAGRLNNSQALILSIALLQTFIQNNYTGPSSSINVLANVDVVQERLVNLLSSGGQPAYGLVERPVLLLLSLILLEQITQQPSIIATENEVDIDPPTISATETPSLLAVAHWWRARALLIHLSLLPEPSGFQPAIIASILGSIDLVHAITKELPKGFAEGAKKNLYIIFYLENVKASLAINSEHSCLPSLAKVKKLTNFDFVLTGARAKRTKFQEKAHSGLIILAESSYQSLEDEGNEQSDALPENLTLDSDTLLEKAHFESIGNEPLDQQIIKSRKLDETESLEQENVFPVAIRQENIPAQLKALNPNHQPRLSGYDDIQLLLRYYVLKNTSPAKDALVEEELGAVIYRIIHQDGVQNYSIFSRALWERSILETMKARTVERGLLQMQVLVEELGLKIKTRLIPHHDNVENPASRLKYIHQLPFIPRWVLDATLADKYMSLGVLKSAVEIYERLHMCCEAALCHAAVGDEKQAELILLKRIEETPKDARAYSILGDIRQDPALWSKSWEIGKYANAKNSWARYCYNPPPSSNLERNYDAVLKHLNDSLRQYPLSFDTWYFYGCVGLECGKMDLAAEAFSRCVSLDPTHGTSWSNLSAVYVNLGKLKESFSCLKQAISTDARSNWRIWENYLIVAFKLNEWKDVLMACVNLVTLKRDKLGEASIDLPMIEKLTELLVSSEYNEQSLSYFQRSCIDFICNTIPSVVTTSSRCWRVVAKVELWRGRPWAALDCHEKAYRAVSHNPDLEVDEKVWEESVDACDDLIAAYESLGEMQGRHGPGSVVCQDWKYKSRATIKTLMSKGKNTWEDSVGWERLLEMRGQL
ncbi:uncharacterized protein ZBAI_01323 [Zygosaccharomyces bailii ISA1307]|uniref:BN860_12684g1_1 n=1 Tax=Zygosaccharomyces bailii (strain CLIB 213 / ATCC 58445 / CBS 680 / BCRC 21525 / NBRC 1098 / NCYC 1416 / NRRL Y-2227) TaxID=1333698 RepID=A0A8J2T3I1_ZYGB2|nr:BN860_12684g1_1 [Zygosaccharomyces bailii CLIB 213]CDH09539.1 uncharacterized protein ZBAI_01323 [Zygosaccharomyces bailii ISA1307]